MKLIVTLQAQKQLLKLPKAQQRKISKKFISIQDNPLRGKLLAGDLYGRYSIRVWPYRIIYFIQKKQKEVWITSIAHRQGVYK